MVSVRLEGESEEIVRAAAKKMGVTVSRVKKRDDCWQLYGSILVYASDAAAS